MDTLWIAGATLVLPERAIQAAVQITGGRIAAIRARPPRRARTIWLRGGHVAPGFVDLHVWGEPEGVAAEAARSGTTGFLTTLGPAPAQALLEAVRERSRAIRFGMPGARCLGIHLEGPFVNRVKAGALPARSMRAPTLAELRRLASAAQGHLALITMAPELPGALAAIRWCARRGIVVSLGHTTAGARQALAAIAAGATAVTHMYNGMARFHHREPSLVDVALTEARLTAMVIADRVHVSLPALRLLVAAKGASGVALVTDSIRRAGWPVRAHRGAFYTRAGRLAGSRLTMLGAVRNAVEAGIPIAEAARMAGEVPARLIGRGRFYGGLQRGARADFVAVDRWWHPVMTMVQGRIAYLRGS